MSSSKEYLNNALKIIKANREKQILIAEKNQQMLYQKHGKLKSFDDQIKLLFTDATRSVANGMKIDFKALSEISNELQQKRKQYLNDIGVDEHSFAVKFNCKNCEDIGYYNGRVCQCVRDLAIKLKYDELNKDVPLENSTFDKFDLNKYQDLKENSSANPKEVMTKLFNYCVKYADGFSLKSPNMLFFGATGLGKTHLSLAIANKVISKGYYVIYGSISRILAKIENEYFSKSVNESVTLKTVLECDLLILDDLGTEFTTQFIVSTIYDIINTRILNNKPTIINTNLNMNQLQDKYSPRIVSRISGCYKLFYFLGEDIRIMDN